MNYHDVLKANIGAELGRRGFTQSKVAVAIGIPQSSFSARLNGSQEFRLNELVVLSAYLQVPLTVLLQGLDGEARGVPA
jgi:transcriptional regulator with XRE-family HTH domain